MRDVVITTVGQLRQALRDIGESVGDDIEIDVWWPVQDSAFSIVDATLTMDPDTEEPKFQITLEVDD